MQTRRRLEERDRPPEIARREPDEKLDDLGYARSLCLSERRGKIEERREKGDGGGEKTYAILSLNSLLVGNIPQPILRAAYIECSEAELGAS